VFAKGLLANRLGVEPDDMPIRRGGGLGAGRMSSGLAVLQFLRLVELPSFHRIRLAQRRFACKTTRSIIGVSLLSVAVTVNRLSRHRLFAFRTMIATDY
jgi:hypothetical protein